MSIIREIKGAFTGYGNLQHSGTARVLEVRFWEDSSLIEIDLHLQAVDMQKWTDLMQITLRVSDNCFRNYVPFGWDAETSTCSLLFNTAQDKTGEQWANQLRTADLVQYTSIFTAVEKLHPDNLLVALGDSSNPAFLLALQQIVSPVSRFEGAVYFDNPQTALLFNNYFNTPLATVKSQNELAHWLVCQNYCTHHTSFYLGGNWSLSSNIQKLLHNLGHRDIQILSFGWSA